MGRAPPNGPRAKLGLPPPFARLERTNTLVRNLVEYPAFGSTFGIRPGGRSQVGERERESEGVSHFRARPREPRRTDRQPFADGGQLAGRLQAKVDGLGGSQPAASPLGLASLNGKPPWRRQNHRGTCPVPSSGPIWLDPTDDRADGARRREPSARLGWDHFQLTHQRGNIITRGLIESTNRRRAETRPDDQLGDVPRSRQVERLKILVDRCGERLAGWLLDP